MAMRIITLVLFTLLATVTVSAQESALSGDPDKAQAAWTLIEEGALVIDVRSEEEFQSGHLTEAVNVPYDQTDALIELIGEDPERMVVLYCGSGRRAELAKNALEDAGYSAIYNASGLDALLATMPED
jgi:phage shock protein E